MASTNSQFCLIDNALWYHSILQYATHADLDNVRVVSRRFGRLADMVIVTPLYGARLHLAARQVTRRCLAKKHHTCPGFAEKNVGAFLERADRVCRNERAKTRWSKESTARCVLMYAVKLGGAWKQSRRAVSWAIRCLSPGLHSVIWSPNPLLAIERLTPGDRQVGVVLRILQEAHARRLQGGTLTELGALAASVFRGVAGLRRRRSGVAFEVAHGISALALSIANRNVSTPLTPYDLIMPTYTSAFVPTVRKKNAETYPLFHICLAGPAREFRLLDGFPCRVEREQDARTRIGRFIDMHEETVVQAYDPNTGQTRVISPAEALELLMVELPDANAEGPGLISEEIE
jgi:hypothetical protein